MKAKARSYFWWPSIDRDIEELSRKCTQCLTNAQNPPKVPDSPWMTSTKPLERVHADFLGPIRNKMFLVITDSYSKWPEVYHMASLEARVTIEKFQNYFARFGLASLIVTDNGKQFVAAEFTDFCDRNGIKYMTTAAYEPHSNGAAGNAVKSFKSGINKACDDPKNAKTPLNTIIDRYLFFYRSSTHSSTQETPHKLLFGREMLTHFDRLRPAMLEKVKAKIVQRIKDDATSQNPVQKHFDIGDEVMIKLFRKNKSMWRQATITKRLGINMYLCEIPGGKQVKKHCDQIQGLKLSTAQSSVENNVTQPTIQPTMQQGITTRSGKTYSCSVRR
ncbi:uncharacterized protein K02A2.6-like [Bradysia coprophila]|uniref:uncharacterized protein K02A2.6-like n=1 Tax=Bradysia coprophila TaxID=38358 RepID=UPI00187D90FC|nr:uncharacterized protein K02A2.6-like [Bradysia coprophila]